MAHHMNFHRTLLLPVKTISPFKSPKNNARYCGWSKVLRSFLKRRSLFVYETRLAMTQRKEVTLFKATVCLSELNLSKFSCSKHLFASSFTRLIYAESQTGFSWSIKLHSVAIKVTLYPRDIYRFVGHAWINNRIRKELHIFIVLMF